MRAASRKQNVVCSSESEEDQVTVSYPYYRVFLCAHNRKILSFYIPESNSTQKKTILYYINCLNRSARSTLQDGGFNRKEV